jgi:transposase
MSRKPYPSDLSDAEWLILKPLIPPAKRGGRIRSANMREIVNAIYYTLSASFRLMASFGPLVQETSLPRHKFG